MLLLILFLRHNIRYCAQIMRNWYSFYKFLSLISLSKFIYFKIIFVVVGWFDLIWFNYPFVARFETYSTELLVWIRGKIGEIRKRDFPNSLDGIQMYFKKFKVGFIQFWILFILWWTWLVDEWLIDWLNLVFFYCDF